MDNLRRRRRAALVAIAALAVLAAPSAAQTQPDPCAPGPATAPLGATTTRPGIVGLHLTGAQGGPVSFFECVKGRAQPLGTEPSIAGRQTSMWAATFWRCGRLERHFAATSALPGGGLARGTTSVRTRSCARRFELVVARRSALGSRRVVGVVDAWGIGGVRGKLCITPPSGRAGCRTLIMRTGVKAVTRRLRVPARGRWRIELRVASTRIRTTLAVGVRMPARKTPPKTLLATGDSTIQGIESFLSDDLGDRATVVSDIRPGFAISKDVGWEGVAAGQVARLRPAATVVSIGANEGWPMTVAGVRRECCGEPWVGEYERRVRRAMRVYLRQGRARVLWLTLPAPRDPGRVPIFAAVNTAILRAGEAVPGVRVVRLDLLFSPSGYRDVMSYGGREVRVREPDGIHLNVAGTQIAERAVAEALQAVP